jgi:nascent polypeptide-associated complex subunit alpha
MSKMGLKPVSGINRVTIKKGKAFVISIDDPDVWKSPGSENAYIIFGKPNMDGLGGSAGQSEVNQFRPPVNPEGAQEATQQATTTATEETTGE